MITMFWMFAIFFGMISFIETRIFFGNGLGKLEVFLWLFSTIIFSFSIGVIQAGSWHNVITFFTR